MGLMFYDLERVEVNKGPQGTLYGRNAMAGTLNIITAKPRLGQSGGFVQAEVANRDGRGAEGAYNLPLGDDMAIRAAFQYVKRDMGYENVSGPKPGMSPTETAAAELMATRKPAGLEDNFGARLSYRWDIGQNTTLNVMADGGRERGTGYPGSNVRDAATFAGLNADQLDLRKIHYRGPQGKLTNDLYGLQAKLDHDFGTFGTELSFSRRSVDFFQTNASSAGVDYPGYTPSTYDDYQSVFWQAKSKANVGELRFYSTDTTSPLQWTAGAFTFSERQASAFFTLTDRGAFYSGTEFTMPDTRVKSNALYADGTFKVTTDTRVLGGLRYSDEKKSRFGIGGNIGFGAGGVGGGNDFNCCIGSRLGTDGFVPALLDRPTFIMPTGLTRDQFKNINEKNLVAPILVQTVKVPGARDTWLQQLTPVANGTNLNGACILTPEINPNGLACPTFNNGGYSFLSISDIPIQQVGSTKEKYGDFRVGFEHDLSKDHMVYAKFSTGHKGGGFNDTVVNPVTQTTSAPIYKPESVKVLEGGTRYAFQFGGRRALANATVFYYDYKDYVLASLACTGTRPNPTTGEIECAGNNLLLENAAGAKIKGLELEVRLPVAAGMQLDLNALLLDARITSGVVGDARTQDFAGGAATLDVSGNYLPLAPKLSLVARFQHKFALGAGQFDWQLVANYKSRYFLDHYNNDDITPANKPPVSARASGLEGSQKAYAQFNVGAGYEFGDGLRLEGWITNLTDKQASQKRIVGSNFDLRFLNDARAYGLRARYTF
jgi:iron complex outermembrane recepter protein